MKRHIDLICAYLFSATSIYTGIYANSPGKAWPAGDYALPQSHYGCPSDKEGWWSLGYIRFPRDPVNTADEWKTNLRGPFMADHIQLNFCSRKDSSVSGAHWPTGSYCIFSYSCPQGFMHYNITWKTGLSGSELEVDGKVSFLDLHPAVTMSLCCQQHVTKTPLLLPKDSHFYLLQETNQDCADVVGMTKKEENPDFLNFWKIESPTDFPDFPDISLKYCLYTPIEEIKECYNPHDRGVTYRGHQNTTKINTTCDPWWYLFPDIGFHWVDDTDTPHQYCRSSFEEFLSPWCLSNVTVEIPGASTIAFRITWCDIPECEINVPPNVASNRPVIQSSTLGYNYAYLTVDNLVGSCSITTKQYRPWLQINLQEIYEVYAVYIDREKVYNATMVNFNIYVSVLDWDFQYGGALLCASNQSSGLHYELWYDCPQPLTGQYVTFQSGIYLDPDYRPQDSMVDLSLCEIYIHASSTGCGRPLGMTSGEMSTFQITASSYDPQLPPGEARLHGNNRWCAEEPGPYYIMVDLIYETLVQGLAMQRTMDPLSQQQQYVNSFKVLYGNSLALMTEYQDYPARTKVFQLSQETNAPEIIMFYQQVTARFLQIHILTYTGRPCLKFEVLGCKGDDDDIVSLPSYAQEAYPVVDTTSGKPCIFPYVYQGELQYGCIADDIVPPWCSTTEDFDRDGQKGDCIILTEGGNAGGAPCVFPFHYWAPTYQTCIGKSNIASWCPTTEDYDRDQKWGYCTAIEKPPMVMARQKVVPLDTVQCSEVKAVRTLQCGWDGISETACLNLDCCYDVTSRINCFMKGIPCQNVSITTEGFFYSPNHPFYYGQLRHCSWYITAPENKFIKLELKRLNLAEKEIRQEKEGYTIDPGQCADRLIVYTIKEDGNETKLRELRHEPDSPTIISPTNRMRVEFNSCARYKVTEAMGFAAYLHFQDCAGCNVGLDECSSQNECTSSCGEITSLNYPLPYTANQRCNWKIQVGREEYIILTIQDFDVRSDSKLCGSDGLYVYDYSIGGAEQLISVFCNYNIPPNNIASSWNQMRLELSTDFDIFGKGFRASYTSRKYRIEDDIKQAIGGVDEDCPSGWIGYQNSCLQLLEQPGGITWLEVEDRCQQLGGHLLSVQNQKEMDLVHYLLTTRWMAADKQIYIGLNDIDVEGKFKWSVQSPMSFTDWALADTTHVTNEPNGGDNEDCTYMKLSKLYSTASWHDTACSYDKVEHYICEVEKKGLNETRTLLGVGGSSSSNCPLDYYTCGSSECVLSAAYCDGHVDCWDGSDEDKCGDACKEYNFQCSNGDCVSISAYCDHKVDCEDESDEISCGYPACNGTEFQCDNFQCIPHSKRCNLLVDCWDGSDEESCAGTCGSEQDFQCYAGNCIPSHARCDGWIDCAGFDHEDETDECLTQRRSCRDWRLSGSTENGIYKIDPDGTGAFSVECNMMSNPGEVITIVHHAVEQRMYVKGFETPGSYIKEVPYVDANAKKLRALMKDSDHCEQFLMFECKGSMLNGFNYYQAPVEEGDTYKQVLFEDDAAVARGECGCLLDRVCRERNETICSCGNNQALWKMDSGFIRDYNKLPFMILNFGDTGHPDEGAYHTLGPLRCYQSFNESQVNLKCKSGNAIDSSDMCLYDVDPYGYMSGCRDATHLEGCENFKCPENYVKCPSMYCIPLQFLCNGVWDCPSGEDEHSCESYQCPGKYHCRNQDYCISLEQRCDGVWQCAEGDDELLCDLPCPSGCHCIGDYYNCTEADYKTFPAIIASSAKKIDMSWNNLVLQTNDLAHFVYLGELELSHNNIQQLNPEQFISQQNLYSLDLSYNKLEIIVPRVFQGLSKLKTLILIGNTRMETVTQGTFQGLSILPELDISGLNIGYIDDFVFEGLESVSFINISHNRIKGISRYGLEYLNVLENLDMQYNQIEAFERATFKALSNIQYMRSDAYKFCCMVRDKVIEENCYPPKDEISSCEDLMKSELLRIFLWIFGLSALLGNAFVLLWRCMRKEIQTVNSYLILNLAGSDLVMGVYMIIVASADMYYRGVYIEKADKWQHSWLCNFAGFLATFSSEASVFALCIITVDRFISIVLAFHVQRITMKAARIIMAILWVVAAIIAAIPLLPLEYFNGEFYARSGVCVSLHLTSEPRPGWEYSVGIFVGLNFVAFVIITLGYLYMYCVVKQSSQAVGSVGSKTNTRDKELALARKMTLIVMTDFFCWAPVILMSILALSGTKISGDVYAWIIVFVLPVNSAINPYLYTVSDLDLVQKFRTLFRRSNDEVSSMEQSNGSTSVVSVSSHVTVSPEYKRAD